MFELSENFSENTSVMSFCISGDSGASRLAHDAVADVDLQPGLVDDGERRERRLVEQNVGAGRAVRLDQNLELRVGRAVLARAR